MATHDTNIDNLRNATLGEQVRGSMIQLFEEDYNLVKRGITIGTDVTSASSSTDGYYDGNVYLNSDTLDLWKLIENVWTLQGNIKGIADIDTQTSTADDGNNVITFVLTDGTQKSFNVKNGSKGSTGVSITGAVDNGDGTFYLTMSNGQRTANVATIQGLKGDKGDRGLTGATGEKGRDVTSILMSGTGKEHPVTATYSDGTTQVIGIVKDGNDGDGTGNMHTDTYDPTKSGIVNSARALSDGTTSIPMSAVQNKADRANTLGGYGIENAYTKDEVDNMISELASDWDSVTEKPFDDLGADFTAKQVGERKQLALSTNVTAKLDGVIAKVDDNVDKGFLTENIIKEYLNNAYVEFNGEKAGQIIANSSTQSVVFYGKAERTYKISASRFNRSVLARYNAYPTIGGEKGTLILSNKDINIHTFTAEVDGWYVWYINSSATDKATNIQVNEDIKSNRELTKELSDASTKLNGLFVEYNANTDRTVEANRIAAIRYLIENYGSCIAAVRYSGGYYHQVIITKFNVDFFITEHTHTTKQIVYWQSNGTTTTKLYTITGA